MLNPTSRLNWIKIQTIKKMEIAGVEVEVLKNFLSDDGITPKVHIPLPEASKTDYVKDYIQNHSRSDLEAGTADTK